MQMMMTMIASCYSNGSDSAHRSRRTITYHSIVFNRWCQYAPPSNTWFLSPRVSSPQKAS